VHVARLQFWWRIDAQPLLIYLAEASSVATYSRPSPAPTPQAWQAVAGAATTSGLLPTDEPAFTSALVRALDRNDDDGPFATRAPETRMECARTGETGDGCPINQTAIWKIENGEPPRRITYDEALAFAAVFDTSLDELSLDPEVYANKELQRLIDRLKSQVDAMVRTQKEAQESMGSIRAILSEQQPEFLVAMFDKELADSIEARMDQGQGPLFNVDLEKVRKLAHEADPWRVLEVVLVFISLNTRLYEFDGQFEKDVEGERSQMASIKKRPDSPWRAQYWGR